MNILHSQITIDRSYGGPARTVPALCDALSKCPDFIVSLVSSCSDNESIEIQMDKKYTLELTEGISRSAFYSKLNSIGRKTSFDLVHDHCVWTPANMAAAKFARSCNIPFVITPRGMLEPWSLGHKALKKKVAWFLYQKRILQQAVLLHATSNEEAMNLRALGLKQPIAVLPNGVDFPEKMPEKNLVSAERTALFVSRIHQKKGLFNLIHAWAQVKPDGWKMKVVGPDQDGHQAELTREINQLGLADVFEFLGPMTDIGKWHAYANAELFILPTYSENFGVVVAEAMAAGLPVITTKGTPWKLLEEERCGWWVDVGARPLANALKAATTISDSERYEMGKRGKRAAYDLFDWNEIGQSMSDVYQWVLGNLHERPDCIRLD